MSTEKEKKEEKGDLIRLINFTINGQPVQARQGWTVLETARHHRIHIPTLCLHETLEPHGVCRLCVVEARQGNWSKVVVSCLYPPFEGVEILTDSERVKNVRRWVLEMLLAECPASKEVKKLAKEYGVTSTRFPIAHPEEECLRCGLCVQVCEEVVGIKAISLASRGVTKHVTTPYMIPNEECVSCGSCVTVCPTGAMKTRLDKIRGDLSKRTGHGYAH